MKATDGGVEGIVTHHPDLDGQAGDAAEHHGQTGAEHGDRIALQASERVRIESSQEGIGMVQVSLYQLLPDVVVPMVSAQAAEAARTGKRRANTALVRKECMGVVGLSERSRIRRKEVADAVGCAKEQKVCCRIPGRCRTQIEVQQEVAP
jgi:hypothetical protein